MDSKISWFPGHMVSTLKMISAELKLCDVIIYVLDARCPRSCVNPKFEDFTNRKPVLFVLNKYDLAVADIGKAFARPVGSEVLLLNSTQSGASKKVVSAVGRLLADKIAYATERGITKTIRAIVVGVTNSGKSTFINNLAGAGKAMTGDKPGVTRTKQWVSSEGGKLWLLDTPGVLMPSFENAQVAKNLAYVGSIKDDILDIVQLAKDLLADLMRLDKDCLARRFGASDFEGICRKRGYILRGGVLDSERGAKAILTEFRSGKIGKFNLDLLL
jgi:ribosome biogenesis GTPase A